jgi:hypothetical protein
LPLLGRYLWTDAFGVVNFLTLAAETGSVTWLEQAERLISGTAGPTFTGGYVLDAAAASTQAGLLRRLHCCLPAAVHDTLGKTRDGSRRLGSATAEEPTR